MKKNIVLIMKYFMLAFFIFGGAIVVSEFSRAILVWGVFPWTLTDDGVALIAGLIEGVIASVAASLVFYQLGMGNEAERQQSNIDEASFIFQYNQAFIKDDNMTSVEHMLECAEKDIGTPAVIDESNIQQFINYLVYLEGLAPLVLKNVISLESIDDLFAYRFFLAMNNSELQHKELMVYPDYYRGCFKLYKKWKNYREKKGLPILNEEKSLDAWLYFNVYANNDLIIRTAHEYDNKKEIAALIYETDPFIYPALFGSNKFAPMQAKKRLPLLMMEKGNPFSLENIVVAECDGRTVGVAVVLDQKINAEPVKKLAVGASGAHVYENYFEKVNEYFYDDESYILCFCVNRKERGKGIGKVMLGSIIKMCKHKRQRLHVLENNKEAIKLYEHYGFKKLKNISEKGYSYNEEKPKCFEMSREDIDMCR